MVSDRRAVRRLLRWAVRLMLVVGLLGAQGALAGEDAGKKKTGQSTFEIMSRLTQAGYPASWDNVRRLLDGDLVLPPVRKAPASERSEKNTRKKAGKSASPSGAGTKAKTREKTKKAGSKGRSSSEGRLKLGGSRNKRPRDRGWKSYYVVIWGSEDSIRPGRLYPSRNQIPVAKRRRVDQYLLFELTRARRPGRSRKHACHNIGAGVTVDEYRVKRSSFENHYRRMKRHLERTGGISGQVVFSGSLAAKKRARRLAGGLRRKWGNRYSVMSMANKPSLPPKCSVFRKPRMSRQ